MKLTEPRALNRIAAYCSKAERCEFDVRKKLVAWELNGEEINRIVKRLKDEQFLSDERFCRGFINDKAKFNKWGKVKISFELRKRNIAESTFKPFLDEIEDHDFEDRLNHILSIKAKSVKGKDNHDIRNKLIRFALSRGFPMDLAIKCVNKISTNTDEYYF